MSRAVSRPSRFLRIVPGLLMIGLLTIVLVLGLAMMFQTGRAPNMPQIVRTSMGPMPIPAGKAAALRVDDVGIPDWSRWGWRITGGRTDALDQRFRPARATATVIYRKEKRTIAYTVVEGTDNVDDEQSGRTVERTPPTGKVALSLGGSSGGFPPSETDGGFGYDCGECNVGQPHLTVKRKIRGRTIVLAGWPVSDRHFDEMQDMALRTAD